MKKIYLAVFLACSIGGAAHAQISEGGIPWSMSLQNEALTSQKIARVDLAAPDYEKYRQEDLQDAINGAAKPYRIGAMVAANLDLMNSGTWTYLEDGRKIWRLEVNIPGSLALDFFYDKFTLPQGAALYVSNKEGTQLLGAYTSYNKNDFNTFTHEPIVGSTAVLELDVNAAVNIANIPFNIARVSPYYRGSEMWDNNSNSSETIVARPTFLGDASPCHKNANCPEGDGEAYEKSKSATLRIVVEDGSSVGFCTGTLMNSGGNTSASCKKYFLTASHCDGANSREDSHFSTWKFTYNYQYLNCDGTGGLESSAVRTGASFRARSNFPSFASSPLSAVADFLLLELNEDVPPLFDIYLNGWNRDGSIHEDLEKDFYIGFHHPAGDAKKMATASFIRNNGRFNQTFINNTHWSIGFTFGGTEPGSSGSGLFDKDGLLIGDLSGGPDGSGACAPLGTNALYSKIGYAWENEFDQETNPGAQSRLKDWLDPAGADMISMPTTKADCSALSANNIEKDLDQAIVAYPNPSNSGLVNVKFNLTSTQNVTITVYNIMGAAVGTYDLGQVKGNNYQLDLSSVANGIYVLNMNVSGRSLSKRVAIAR